MKIAVDTYSFFMNFGRHRYKPSKPWTLSQYFDFVSENRLDGIHMDPAHFDPVRDVAVMDRFCKENYLYIELGAMEILSDDFTDYLNAAHITGSKILRTFVGGSCNDESPVMKDRVVKSKEKLAGILPLAEKYNIKIAVENHIDVTMDELDWLIDFDSPYIGICYDSGNFAAVGEDPVEALNRFNDRILCTHIKDVCAKELFSDAPAHGLFGKEVQFCALGEGILPINEILCGLMAIKGDYMRITLEIPTPLQKSLSEDSLLQLEKDNVLKSIEYVKCLKMTDKI